MVQSLNPSAIWTLTTAVLRRPSLMIPDFQVATIADIDWQALQQATAARAVVLDKDNTLTRPYQMEIHESCRASMLACLQQFAPTAAVAVLSNSAGTATDDPDGADAAAFEAANVDTLKGHTLPVIRHQAKKPSAKCWQQVVHHFATQQPSIEIDDPSQVILVGDRLWTDVVFGNLYGCTTVYCAQTLDDATDHWTAKRIRPVEQRVARFWQRVLRQQPQVLLSSSSNKNKKDE